jgi:hypothetical protein
VIVNMHGRTTIKITHSNSAVSSFCAIPFCVTVRTHLYTRKHRACGAVPLRNPFLPGHENATSNEICAVKKGKAVLLQV